MYNNQNGTIANRSIKNLVSMDDIKFMIANLMLLFKICG